MSGIMAMMLGAFPSELTDPYFKNTVLLLHGDGTNAAQNNTFLDSSSNNFTITRNGNPTQGTFSPFSKEEGKWGVYFDGTGDYLNLGGQSAFAFGTGDWTIEMWVYPTAVSGTKVIYDARATGVTGNAILYLSGSTLIYNAADGDRISAGTVVANAWQHIAVARSGTSTKLFLDGVQIGSTWSDSTNYAVGASRPIIGEGGYVGGYAFPGYISNVRVVKGTAVYTVNFTPSTTPLTAITNTSLLCCQSNRFKDNSSNTFAITAAGNVAVTPFSPFANSAAYSAATNGGSGYFDGTGDYLSIASNAAFDQPSDFTVEYWAYFTANTNHQMVFSRGTGHIGIQHSSDANAMLRLIRAGQAVIATGGNISINNWTHFAITRSGSTVTGYINGVSVASGSDSTATASGAALLIGYDSFTPDSFDGYVHGLRVVKGTALTVSVPTAPYTGSESVSPGSLSLLTNFTNAGIIDNTGFNDLETVGNAQISTSVKKYGTGSLAFDGTGDWLYTLSSSALAMGTGDFTIECWAYLSVASGNMALVSSSNFEVGYRNASGKFAMWSGAGLTLVIDGTTSISTGTWYHVAVVRSSGTSTLYVNGSSQGTYADTTNYSNLVSYVGSLSGTGENLNGYIDDLRITKGYARYTANFTPPTQAFADK